MDLYMLEYEMLINMVSNSTLQPAFKSQPLVEFWCNIKEEFLQLFSKAIQIIQPHTCVRVGFLYSLQPKQYYQQMDKT